MVELCNKLGKDNIYNSVKEWLYIDTGIKLSFYIFYSSGATPGEVVCREVVRQYLINKYGLEKAKQDFPKLFISDQRKIFCVYDNTKLPIDYQILTNYVEQFNIVTPEVIHVLDYKSPLLVEYGLSDIYVDYDSQEGTNPLNNTFLFYISQVLNYYNGKLLSTSFIQESQFTEYDDYCSVVTSGIEWQIMKKTYTGSYFQLDN